MNRCWGLGARSGEDQHCPFDSLNNNTTFFSLISFMELSTDPDRLRQKEREWLKEVLFEVCYGNSLAGHAVWFAFFAPE
jgi:hypothetical protein